MTSPVRYLIDSNVLIEAHRRYYAFDICPGFWDSLVWLHGENRLLSLDKVRDEIVKESDRLVDWAKTTMPDSGFVTAEDDDVVEWFGKMQVWAQAESQFTAAAKEEFASVADPWLVAYSKSKKMTVVTQEVYNKEIKKKIPIPNVCKAFDVECIDAFEMLQRLTVSYHWKKS